MPFLKGRAPKDGGRTCRAATILIIKYAVANPQVILQSGFKAGLTEYESLPPRASSYWNDRSGTTINNRLRE